MSGKNGNDLERKVRECSDKIGGNSIQAFHTQDRQIVSCDEIRLSIVPLS